MHTAHGTRHTVGRHIRTVCGVPLHPLVYNNATARANSRAQAPSLRCLRHRMSSLGPCADLHRTTTKESLPATGDPSRIKYAPVISLCSCQDITAGDRQRTRVSATSVLYRRFCFLSDNFPREISIYTPNHVLAYAVTVKMVVLAVGKSRIDEKIIKSDRRMLGAIGKTILLYHTGCRNIGCWKNRLRTASWVSRCRGVPVGLKVHADRDKSFHRWISKNRDTGIPGPTSSLAAGTPWPYREPFVR